MPATVIVQARLNSTRLPGKVLMDIEGKPLVLRVIERVREKRLPYVVAVPWNDRYLIDWLRINDIEYAVGSEEDLLDRYYHTAVSYDADPVIRITADCPCVDGDMIMNTLGLYLENDYDYVTFGNMSSPNVPDYPDGFDVEVFSFEVLEQAWLQATEREHVGRWMLENCRYGYLPFEDRLPVKLSVDTVDDLLDVRKLYKLLGDKFGIKEAINGLYQLDEVSRTC